jgi:lambda family phage portal protein
MSGIESSTLHEGASRARRLGSWGSRNVNATDEVTRELALLRDRSRELRRNNPWVNRAINISTAMHIGNGVRPRPSTPDQDFNDQLLELWRDWADYADYSSKNSNVYSIQDDLGRGKNEAGEAFAVIHKTRDLDSPLNLSIQVLESDQCPLYLNRYFENGNQLKSGIELTSKGKIVAYWFYTQHPNLDMILSGNFEDIVRVKAENVIHYFKPERPSQLRGRPLVTSSIVKAKTYEEYTDSELLRKATRAKFTGTIERESYSEADYKYNPISGEPLPNSTDVVPEIALEAGSFPALLAGEKLNLFEGDKDSQGFAQFQEWQVLAISAGMSIPYALVSGDWKAINDRVWKAIFNVYKREIEKEQDIRITTQILKPLWRAFVNRAIDTNVIKTPLGLTKWQLHRAKFKYQAFEYLHVLQDVQSDVLRVSAGFESRESVIERTGKDVTIEEVDAQRKATTERETELHLRTYEEYIYGEKEKDEQIQKTGT